MKHSPAKPIIFFDGLCNLCNSSVDEVVRWDKNHKFKIASLQGETAKSLLPLEVIQNLDSLVLLKNNKLYTKSSAAIRVLVDLKWSFKIFYILLVFPKFIRDAIYSVLARNRYKWFGKKKSCRLPTSKEKAYFLP